ncbi:MAG: SurA N-terminal domain-containing protein [Geminicoccaceae bacterium]|nr:SurA N-terminal domain-containing protein [Geminicoccaceae bacterium]
MLEQMRGYASSWVVKALLGILIVSFAVWGIGDVFRRAGTGSAAVATVGGLEIGRADLDRALENSVEDLRQRLGQPIDRRQAIALGALNDSLSGLIARRLVDRHGQDLGLGVADGEVAAAIRANPLFQGAGGFDRARLDMFLRSQGMGEADMVAQVRDDVRRQRLVLGLTGPATVPEALARRIDAYRGERRTGRLLTVQADALVVPEPDDAALKDYLKAHQAAFRAPERRDLVFLRLTPEAMAPSIAVDDADVAAAYDARKASLAVPERRTVGQIRAPSEALAERARQAVLVGAPIEQAAMDLAKDGIAYDTLGPIARDALPGALGEAVFKLDQGEVSPVVKSPFGFHVFRLDSVEPARTPPLKEVRDDIVRELRHERAIDALPRQADALNDEIAAGSTLEEAAANLGLSVEKAAKVDAQGRNERGGTVAGLTPEILADAFKTGEGETSLLGEAGDGYYMVRVTGVEPARDLTLDEARDEVKAAVLAEKRTAAATERAASLLKRAKDGEALTALARGDPALRVETVGPLRRDDAADLAPDALAALFRTPAGGLADGPLAVPAGAAVLRTLEVLGVPADADVAGLSDELLPQIRSDFLAQYEAALRARYPVEIDEAVLAGLVGDGGS